MPVTVRGGLPVIIERGVTQTLTFVVLKDGELATVSAGTITILDEVGTVIVNAAALTISSGTCTYSLNASLVPATLQPSERWQVTLSLTVSALTETIVKDAVLALHALHPIMADADLLARHSDLATLLPSNRTSWFSHIDAAHEVIGRRLLSRGRRPWLVMSPWSFYDCHLNLALSLVFSDLETYTSGSGKYAEMAAKYMQDYESAWTNLEFHYDAAASGNVRDAASSVAGQPSIWLC